MDVELTKDEILLHYEELGDFDYKIKVTLYLVGLYIQATSGCSEWIARKAAECLQSEEGWAKVLDQDERFYVWCKNRFINKAMTAKGKKRKTIVYWIDKEGVFKKCECQSLQHGLRVFARLSQNVNEIALYKFALDDKTMYSSPLRRKKATKLLDMVEAIRLHDLHEAQYRERVERCQRHNKLERCEDCEKFGIEDAERCPLRKGDKK